MRITLNLSDANLMDLSVDEQNETNGGWVLAVLGTAGLVVSGVWAIGFVAGAAYATGEYIYNKAKE